MSRARDIANYGDGIDTSSITSGTLADARIPNLATSKITSGTFADARIAQSNVTQHESAIDALGTVTTGTFNGTIGSSATFPAGHVVQVVPHTNSAGTNVTSTSITALADSRGAITLKTDNPLILYNAVLGYESDTTASTNFFFDLRYSTDNSTYTPVVTTTRINGTHVDNGLGTGSVTIVSHHDTSGLTGFDTGSTIYYQLYFTKSTASSVYFNQQGLSGQPGGTSNITSAYIMEVQQ